MYGSCFIVQSGKFHCSLVQRIFTNKTGIGYIYHDTNFSLESKKDNSSKFTSLRNKQIVF